MVLDVAVRYRTEGEAVRLLSRPEDDGVWVKWAPRCGGTELREKLRLLSRPEDDGVWVKLAPRCGGTEQREKL